MKSKYLSGSYLALITFSMVLSLSVSHQSAKAQTRRSRTVVDATLQRVPPPEAEQLLWQEVLRRDTIAAFKFYLREFSQGAYALEARTKIAEIAERTEKAKWNLAVVTNSKSSFETYLKEFPNGGYSTEAKERIKRFEREAEGALWKEVDRRNEATSYNEYLKKYPSGVYSSIARLRLSSMGVSFRMPDGDVGTFVTNSIGMELAWIPDGSFMMGLNPAQVDEALAECKRYYRLCERYFFSDESPQRLVTIRQGFWMGRHEVTQGQYEAVMGTNPSRFSSCGKDCPVERISWNDAKEFVKRLSDRNDGFVYSLPSEAEWEYAARAGTTTATALSDSLYLAQGNSPYRIIWKDPVFFPLSTRGTTKVGSYTLNTWGLYDMLGNVAEWVEDFWNENYSGLPTDGSANGKGVDESKVFRGESWGLDGYRPRFAERHKANPSNRSGFVGFRVVARAR